MSTVTKPVVLDETVQETNVILRQIRNAISGNKAGIRYAFHIDPSESDPSAAVTYLDDAVGMTPAYMDFANDKFYWGTWGSAFFIPRPCMLKYDGTVDYYLDPDDYTKKADGSASDIANASYAGNAMMEWGRDGKRIYYKIVPDSDDKGATIYVADYYDEGYKFYSFINSASGICEHFYTPIYNGYYDGTRQRSISGVVPTAGASASVERTRCRANGSDIWDTEVYCDAVLINILLILMGKSLNTQAVFGQGLTTGGTQAINEGFNTGVHNAKGLFYGTNANAADVYANAVKVFGMENWWGYLWRRIGGLVTVDNLIKYKMTRCDYDGTGLDDYAISATAADYVDYLSANEAPTGGYVKSMEFDENQFAPVETGGSASTYYADNFYINAEGVRYAYRGGYSYNGTSCGAFCVTLDNVPSNSSWTIAASPSCKPLS